MHVVTISSKLAVKPNILFREMDGEAVLLNMDSGVYFWLDPIGTEVWKLIKEKNKIRFIVRMLTKEFEVDELTCQQDVLRLSEWLYENGLVAASN